MDITEPLQDDGTRSNYSIENVNLAYDGLNYIFVTYANMVNRPAAQVNVVKDKSPAVFAEFSIDPLYISPNGDGVQDYAGISFRLNEPGTVYYKCYNSSGSELKNEAISASGNTLSQITWDGLDENGRNLKEGIYDIRLFVADSLGNISPDSDKLNSVVLDVTPPSLTGLDSVLTPFSPNGDNIQDNALINYALSEKCYVTITINDTAGNVIRTVRDNELRNKGAYEEAWDGIDDAGTRPAEKEYVIRIDYHDQAGNKGVTAQSRTELDVTAPLILKQTAEPTNFSSKGKGSQGTEIKYQLTDNAYVTIRALNSSGQEVCTVIGGLYRDQGYNTDVWKGNNSNGEPVPDGIYTLKIEASDDAGNTAESRTIEVKVVSDTILPVISNISDSPDPITPSSPYSYGKNDVSTISYTLSDDHPGDLRDVNVRVYNKYGSLKQTLVNLETQTQGDHNVSWNGRDSFGEYCNDGLYIYRIDASDKAGNKAYFKTGTITIDNIAPEIKEVYAEPDAISPDNPDNAGINDEAKIVLKISDALSSSFIINCSIYNSSNRIVRTLASNISVVNPELKTMNFELIWDGKDINGVYVPDGYYYYGIIVKDTGGNQAGTRAIGKIMVDNTPPVITNMADGPDPFSPNPPLGDGMKDLNCVDFTVKDNLDYNIQATLNIYNTTDNSLVYSVNKPLHLMLTNDSRNTNHELRMISQFYWDGKNTGNLTVPDGIYRYELSATDTAGNSRLLSGSAQQIEVDNTPPEGFSGVSAEPGIFSPDGNETDDKGMDLSRITYTTSESNMHVSSKIFGEADKYDWTARGFGRYYPPESFSFVVKATGYTKAYEQQNADFKIIIRGVEKDIKYPTFNLHYRIRADGTENKYKKFIFSFEYTAVASKQQERTEDDDVCYTECLDSWLESNINIDTISNGSISDIEWYGVGDYEITCYEGRVNFEVDLNNRHYIYKKEESSGWGAELADHNILDIGNNFNFNNSDWYCEQTDKQCEGHNPPVCHYFYQCEGNHPANGSVIIHAYEVLHWEAINNVDYDELSALDGTEKIGEFQELGDDIAPNDDTQYEIEEGYSHPAIAEEQTKAWITNKKVYAKTFYHTYNTKEYGFQNIQGLYAEYYSDLNFNDLTYTSIDGSIEYYWDNDNPIPYTPMQYDDRFSVRWTGYVFIPSDDTYTFYPYCEKDNNSIAFYFQDTITPVVNKDFGENNKSFQIFLEGNKWYPIKMELRCQSFPVSAHLDWATQSGTINDVIQSQYFKVMNPVICQNIACSAKEPTILNLNKTVVLPDNVFNNGTPKYYKITNLSPNALVFFNSNGNPAAGGLDETQNYSDKIIIMTTNGVYNEPWPELISKNFSMTCSGAQTLIIPFSNYRTFSIPAGGDEVLEGFHLSVLNDHIIGDLIHIDPISGLTNLDPRNPTHIRFRNTYSESWQTANIVKKSNDIVYHFDGSGNQKNVFDNSDYQVPAPYKGYVKITNWNINVYRTGSSNITHPDISISNIVPNQIAENPEAGHHNGDFEVKLSGSIA
ncbi:MAG: FlgD immunoglobulin-like domain containing protein, partial [bacterium]|nr:FlgD immunoglobulin-like domain containing protein [bacterium]